MFDREAAVRAFAELRRDSDRVAEEMGLSRRDDGAVTVQFVFEPGELSPEERAAFTEHLQKHDGLKAMADAWYGEGKHTAS